MTARDTNRQVYEAIRDGGVLNETQVRVYEHLYKHGPCTGGELTDALRKKDEEKPQYLRCARELVLLGCAARGAKRLCQLTGKANPTFDVTSKPPDVAKLRAAQSKVVRPSNAVLNKAIPELLAHCRGQRDLHGHTFTPEFMQLCLWLKTLVKKDVPTKTEGAKPGAPTEPKSTA